MTQEIRAAVCRGHGAPLVVETLHLAAPGVDSVRVRVKAVAICCSDVSYIDGSWGGGLPAVYGHEASGVVEEVGEGVDKMKPGDPVAVTLVRSCGYCPLCSRGEESLCSTDLPPAPSAALRTLDGEPVVQGMGTAAFATHVVVHQSQLVPLPVTMPLDEAALLACAAITGVGAVIHESGCRLGDSIAVIGVGGVGLNSVQGAVWAGAAKIIAIDVQQAKLQKALEFGATHAVDASSGDVAAAVRSLNGGEGVDRVIVAVGAIPAIEQSFALLRRGGTVVLAGMAALGQQARFTAVDFVSAAFKMRGSKMGSGCIRTDIPRLVERYSRGQFKLAEMISGRYGLDQINEAVAAAKSGESLRNMILF